MKRQVSYQEATNFSPLSAIFISLKYSYKTTNRNRKVPVAARYNLGITY